VLGVRSVCFIVGYKCLYQLSKHVWFQDVHVVMSRYLGGLGDVSADGGPSVGPAPSGPMLRVGVYVYAC
jgi:hypothetical protein